MSQHVGGLFSVFVKLLSGFLAMLPPRIAVALGSCLGRLVYFFSNRRKVIYSDLKMIFGSKYSTSERQKIVRRHFAHLGQTAVEVLRFPSMNQEFVTQRINIHHLERFQEAVKEDKGLVLLTGHFGNWEMLQIVSGILGQPLHVLAQNQRHERFNQILNELRESHGSKAVIRGMGIRGLIKALKEKQLIGLLGDRAAGKTGGVILPLLGKKTTVPTGAFEMARRTGSVLLPCFDVRMENGQHEIFVGDRIDCGAGEYELKDLEPAMMAYLKVLESFIEKHPEQWLWGGKRWKYTWTKRIVVLSDGKPGHVKQSLSLASHMKSLHSQYGREGMEYPTETIEVKFKSDWHRKLFRGLAFLFIPWVQGRMGILKPFLTEETWKQVSEARADFVISSGSSLIPLNLCLAKECRGKSLVLMKPGFPYNFFRYDLAVIPAHDQGAVPKETFRTFLTPNLSDPQFLESSADYVASRVKDKTQAKWGIFIGGNTRNYVMDLHDIERVLTVLEAMGSEQGDYMLTTSRRTGENICSFLKQKEKQLNRCQLLTIGSENTAPEIAPGMMEVAENLIVTEDSISMISEAVATGKKVIVLTMNKKHLPPKHQRFQEILAEKGVVSLCSADSLKNTLENMSAEDHWQKFVDEQNQALQKKLEAIL